MIELYRVNNSTGIRFGLRSSLFPAEYQFQNEQHPGSAVQYEIKPVNGPDKTALKEHGKFL